MPQKRTFILVITILLTNFAFITSCKKDVDEVNFVKYKYINSTPKAIKIEDYKDGRIKTYNLSAGDTLVGRVDLFSGAGYDVFALPYSDSLLLIYDNIILQWMRENHSDRNPLLLTNYQVRVVPEKEDEYLFTFVESDF